MKNSIGTSVILTLFGESHGPSVGCVLDGLAPGIPVDEEEIARLLSLRRPFGAISTGRVEMDPFVIESGVINGRTTGAPLTIRIPNENTRSGDYDGFLTVPRPGHADYTAAVKYGGFQDVRGGGHFSGRLTAPLVAAGGILLPALRAKGITVATHIKELAGIRDRSFGDFQTDARALIYRQFAVLDDEIADAMQTAVLDAKGSGDSVGGVLETVVLGMPAGVGEPTFDTVEGELAKALFSIPAVKGVSFGAGFEIARMRGSEANDPFRVEDGKITVRGTNQGGVNGGITNGGIMLIQTAVKPTPTIAKEQDTVDLSRGENTTVSGAGRHDPCIVHRARVVADAVVALVLTDLLARRFGTDFLAK